MWSLENYCAFQQPIDLDALHVTSQSFLEALGLPSIHPFCESDAPPFHVDGIPPMGRLHRTLEDESTIGSVITFFSMVAPTLMAMSELWLRLFAGALAPLGILYLVLNELNERKEDPKKEKKCPNSFSWLCIFSLASSLVLMTDTLYVLDNGKLYGAALFVSAVVLSTRASFRYKLKKVAFFTSLTILLASHLVWHYETGTFSFGNKADEVLIQEGLYHDTSNPYVSSIVNNWPERYRIYTKEGGATSWMPSGDSRTGFPFLANHLPQLDWKRFFLATVDDEYVALDISFPPDGYNDRMPIYMVLHGLNGGTDEEYIRDLAFRRNAEGSTVVVMIARGLMDLPIRGWNLFNGARTTDAHSAAVALRRALSPNQIIVGVGYSMGAIVLNNYVASYGATCALDAAIALSGGLDMRFQGDFFRAQRLWQPMLTETARDEFFIGKWGHKVKARLSRSDFVGLMRAKHITALDITAVAPYSGYDNVTHYYSEMSALGDIDHKRDGTLDQDYKGNKKVDSISIPLVVLQALDDPLVTWRATCANKGLMHPENLVKTGSGNLIILLTNAGGHVGWPLGLFFFQNKWKWMSDAVMGFAHAVHEVKQAQR